MNFDKTKVVVVIPCYNEVKIVKQTIESVANLGYTVIAVDDGSSDGTHLEIECTSAILLRHCINLGQGASIETGLEYLRRNSVDFEFVCTFDADGQHEINNIANLYEKILTTKANVILGTRFGRNQFNGNTFKKYLLKIAAKMTQFTIGIKVTDRHNGLRLLDRYSVEQIRITTNGFGHADEFLHKIKTNNLRYEEEEVDIKYTAYSVSKGQPLYNAITIFFDRLMTKK